MYVPFGNLFNKIHQEQESAARIELKHNDCQEMESHSEFCAVTFFQVYNYVLRKIYKFVM